MKDNFGIICLCFLLIFFMNYNHWCMWGHISADLHHNWRKTVKNRYFSKIKGQMSSKLPFLRNLDFYTPNLVSDGSFGFSSKGDNYFWEKIPKTDHSSNIRIIFSCLVLGKSSKIALFHTVFWIPRYSADLGPFLTQNHKIRSKMDQKKCGPHMANDTFCPQKV